MASPASPASVTHNGYRWQLAAEGLPPGGGTLLQEFPTLEGLPGARVLKSNHFRTVIHVPAPGGTGTGVIAKVYRYTSAWDRFRYRWIRPRALQEWNALLRFQRLGLPAPRVFAVAERREGGSIRGGGLLLEYLAGTRPLSEVAHEAGSAAGELLEQVGQLIRRLHDAGVWHRDLHSGNLLIGSRGELHLIDLHTCVFQRKLLGWQRRDGVAKLLQSLRASVPPEGLRALITAYGPDALGGDLAGVERRLLLRVDALRRKRQRSRSKRCFLPSTQFTVTREPGARLYHLREVPAAELAALWSAEPPGAVLKRTRRGWIARGQVAGRDVCVKHLRYGILEGLQALVESHRLRRAYAGGHALAVRGLPTPQVVALREERRLGLVRAAFLVTSFIEGAAPLDGLLFDRYWERACGPGGARDKRDLARSVGGLLRAIHDLGLYTHDLSPQNLLVRFSREGGTAPDPPQLFLTDLDHLYLWKPLTERGRLHNLAALGNLPEGHVTTTDRLRALRAYARGEPTFLERSFLRELRGRLLRLHWKTLGALVRGEREVTPGGEPGGGRP